MRNLLAASTTVRMRNKEMWKHFNCPASLVSGQRENQHGEFHSTSLLGASVDAWMTCQLVYTLHVTVHYTSSTMSPVTVILTLLYYTERVFVNQKLSSTYGPFCMTNRYLFDMWLLLNALFINYADFSGHTIWTTRTLGRSTSKFIYFFEI